MMRAPQRGPGTMADGRRPRKRFPPARAAGMMRAMPIYIRYHPLVGSFCLVAGLFIIYGGLVSGGPHLFLLGGLQVVVGALFLTKPWYVVHPDRIEVRNPFGMTVQTHRLRSLADLDVDGGTVRLEGVPLRGVSRGVARREDWAAFMKAIEAARRG